MITLETGKIVQESLGEVQEMIDICDFAVGLSRQLYGLTIASERPNHRMMEQWHPLGPVLVISAFNFPLAVWAWNAALALVCGNPVIWKPSEKAPLCAEAVMAIVRRAMDRFGDAPEGWSQLVQGERDIGEKLVDDPRIALVSATGRHRWDAKSAPRVAQRFGMFCSSLAATTPRSSARAPIWSSRRARSSFRRSGTAGQRCTTLRRLIVHESIADQLVARFEEAFAQVKVGDPRQPDTLVGPLIDEDAFDGHGEGARRHSSASTQCRADSTSGRRMVEVKAQEGTVLQETFAPILYVLRYSELEEAIALNNAVPQGLSSSIFTTDLEKPSCSCPRGVRIAELPTSISARPARRSAARSAARRRRAAAARAVRTAGAPTCAARPTRSITARTYRSRRASGSTSRHKASSSSADQARPALTEFVLPGLELRRARAAAR